MSGFEGEEGVIRGEVEGNRGRGDGESWWNVEIGNRGFPGEGDDQGKMYFLGFLFVLFCVLFWYDWMSMVVIINSEVLIICELLGA